MLITGLYVALLTLLALILALRVSFRRRAIQVGVGDGGDADMQLRQRAHANLLENAPLALLLLLLLELGHTQIWLLHAFGIALLVGRILHAWGLSHSGGPSFGRMVGTLLTWLAMLAMIVLLLWQHVVVWTL